MQEFYQQLLLTKLNASRKTKPHTDGDEKYRLCRNAQESVAHMVASCSALLQTLYRARHNAALKILFFETVRGYQLADDNYYTALVLTSLAQTGGQGDGVLGCACFRGALASESQQSRR